MTMITPSYLGETIEYSSLHACRSTLEDPTLDGAATWATANLNLLGTSGAVVAAGPNQFLSTSGLLVAVSLCYGSPGGIGAP